MLNAAPSKDEFELPDVHGENAKWRWVDEKGWRIEGAENKEEPSDDDVGWVYYDNKVCVSSLSLSLTKIANLYILVVRWTTRQRYLGSIHSQ